MKVLFLAMALVLLSYRAPIDWKDVMNDFNQPFHPARFSKRVLLIRQDFQDKIFDTTYLRPATVRKSAWTKIHSVMGRCDYIVMADTAVSNGFLISSNKAYEKFWVKYDSDDKIAIIKMIKPAITEHLIPPPCGY